jgi:DNA-binding MarR family transcriptional regulator
MSIIPLISSWEQYIITHPTGDLQDFGRWLQTPVSQPTLTPQLPTPFPESAAAEPDFLAPARLSLGININLDAGGLGTLLVARLHMINHFLSKPVIRKLGFTKDAEFSVLIQVHLMNQPNKKELCRQLLIQNSTGVEITRRLAKKGLLRETIDPNDRRSARLSLTEKGQRLLKEGYSGFKSIHKGFLTPLSPDQQLQFVTLLTHLHEYHSDKLRKQFSTLQELA